MRERIACGDTLLMDSCLSVSNRFRLKKTQHAFFSFCLFCMAMHWPLMLGNVFLSLILFVFDASCAVHAVALLFAIIHIRLVVVIYLWDFLLLCFSFRVVRVVYYVDFEGLNERWKRLRSGKYHDQWAMSNVYEHKYKE